MWFLLNCWMRWQQCLRPTLRWHVTIFQGKHFRCLMVNYGCKEASVMAESPPTALEPVTSLSDECFVNLITISTLTTFGIGINLMTKFQLEAPIFHQPVSQIFGYRTEHRMDGRLWLNPIFARNLFKYLLAQIVNLKSERCDETQVNTLRTRRISKLPSSLPLMLSVFQCAVYAINVAITESFSFENRGILVQHKLFKYRWFSGKLWYLQHNCVGDTIVYH